MTMGCEIESGEEKWKTEQGADGRKGAEEGCCADELGAE